MNTNIDNNIVPSKNNTFDIGSEDKMWKNTYTKNLYTKNAKIKKLTVKKLSVSDMYIPPGPPGPRGPSGENGSNGTNGTNGTNGSEGPALFTLFNNTGTATLTSNSITTIDIINYIIDTVESYNTAFLTFKLVDGTFNNPSSIGLVSVNFINTFAFAFQFNTDNTFSLVYNGGGAVGSYPYSLGDLFTICLTSSSCDFFQNGILINTIVTNISYLNVKARFYIDGIVNITNIAFGYLNDVSNVLAYTYNDGTITSLSGFEFLNLNNSSYDIILVNCSISSDYILELSSGIYSATISYNDSTQLSSICSIYLSTDSGNTWNSIGSGIASGVNSGSNTVMINVPTSGYLAVGTSSSFSSEPASGSINLTVTKL